MLDLLFPPRCVLCDAHEGGLCTSCVDRLSPPPALMAVPAELDELVSICSYEAAGRELVLALKRGNRRDALALLGASIADAIAVRQFQTSPADPLGVTWAPTTPARKRSRGFDQSQELAASVARGLGCRAVRTLGRTGSAQMGLDRHQRQRSPGFVAIGAPRATPRRWVLVDDVVTTGSTMTSAARVLRATGAVRVVGAAIALAP